MLIVIGLTLMLITLVLVRFSENIMYRRKSIKIYFYINRNGCIYEISLKKSSKEDVFSYKNITKNSKRQRIDISNLTDSTRTTYVFLNQCFNIYQEYSESKKFRLTSFAVNRFLSYDRTIYVKIETNSGKTTEQFEFKKPEQYSEPKQSNDSLSYFNLPSSATFADYKKKYYELSKKYHPDNGGDLETMKIINFHFSKVKLYFQK